MANNISDWLNELGLRQYAPAFEANEITVELAPTLTDDDLRELGVRPLGHRRRLMTAIAALRGLNVNDKSTPLERRFLTVMFCDLVDSTVLSTIVDPEVMASIIAKYEGFCSAVVTQHGGFVARYIGDGVLAYFGYPTAFEDSAERAIRAALMITKDIETVYSANGIRLRVRIGIASGPVVVGDIGGHGANKDAVIGQTPNLAARLQTLAEENGVVVADPTYRLAGYRFRCLALGDVSVRGFAEPVRAWRILSERSHRARFAARQTSNLTPFVGRDAEFEVLAKHWRAATEGSGRVVMITGEAGIGKSRLVRQFTAAIVQQQHRVMTYSGSPHLQSSPLRPVIIQIERDAQMSVADSPAAKRVKLEALLSDTPELAQQANPVISRLLSLQRETADAIAAPTAGSFKRQALDVLMQWIEARARSEPLVVVCEDVHWFDPTTCELIETIAERIGGLRVLLVLTYRSEFKRAWKSCQDATTVRLERLNKDSGRQIVEHVSMEAPLSSEMTRLIVSKGDGVPLFIEELTRSVLESHATSSIEEGPASLAVPDSLQDTLVARLERLAGVKEIAQVGAAMGREFRTDIVAVVTDSNPVEVADVIRRLCDADLVEQRDVLGGQVATFKHALVQDAIYETLLHARRKLVHRRIAEVLQEKLPETCENQPEVLAFHWERAGAHSVAAQHFIAAGKLAAGRSATTEASMHFRSALRLCTELPAAAERDQLELEAALHQGGVLRATRGPHSDDTGRAFSLARDICLRTGNQELLFPALAGLFGYYLVGAKNREAEGTAQALLRVAEARQDRFYQMVGHRAVGMVHLHTGAPQHARFHLERSLALYDEAADGPAAFSYGTDHAQTASSFLALALWVLGFADQALAREVWATEHGSRLNHRYSLVQTAMFRITRNALARNWNVVQALAEDTCKVAIEHGFPLAKAMAQFYLTVCRVAGGESTPDLLRDLDQAIRARGPINYHPFCLSLMAEAYAVAGDLPGALKLLSSAELVVEATGENWIKAELMRLRGEMLMAGGSASVEEVERLLVSAAAQAGRQGARTWQLRATVSLSKLLLSDGRTDEAREKLEPLYGGFREGLDTPDLTSARRLLDAMSMRQSTARGRLPAVKYCFS